MKIIIFLSFVSFLFFFLSLFSFLSSFLAPLVRGIVFTTSEHWISEASKLNILAIQNNRLNQHGTPFLHDMYLKAFAATDSYFGMYANGDILFSEDFVTTMCSLKSAIDHGVIKERVLLGERREKDNDSIPFCIIFFFFSVSFVEISDFMHSRTRFCSFNILSYISSTVGKRLNHKLSLDHEITSDVKDHTDKILKWAKTAQLFANNAQDFFAVTRATFNWESMPQYVIGRPAYDNCLVSQAVKNSKLIFLCFY